MNPITGLLLSIMISLLFFCFESAELITRLNKKDSLIHSIFSRDMDCITPRPDSGKSVKKSDKESEGYPGNKQHYSSILQACSKPAFTHLSGDKSGEEPLEQSSVRKEPLIEE